MYLEIENSLSTKASVEDQYLQLDTLMFFRYCKIPKIRTIESCLSRKVTRSDIHLILILLFITPNEIINSGNNHHWLLSPLAESFSNFLLSGMLHVFKIIEDYKFFMGVISLKIVLEIKTEKSLE